MRAQFTVTGLPGVPLDHAVKVAEEVHNTAEEPVVIQHRLAEVKAAPDHLTTRVPATQKDAQLTAAGHPGPPTVAAAGHAEQEAHKQGIEHAPTHLLRMAERHVQDIQVRAEAVGIKYLVHEVIVKMSRVINSVDMS